MFRLTRIIRGILKRKNAQLRAEREKLQAAEWANKILSAYIAVLCESGEVKIKKSDISRALAQSRVEAVCTDEHYILRSRSEAQTTAVQQGNAEQTDAFKACNEAAPERGGASGG